MSDSCNPMKCSLPGSSVHGILQARIPEWVAISFSRGTSLPKNWTQVSRIAGRWFTDTGATQEAQTSPDILYNPCPSSRIRHFSKETRFLLLENGIRSQDLAAWYTIVWINTLFIHPSIYGYLGCFLEKAMAPHSSTLAWRIPGTGEPGGLPSMGSHRVGHDWSDLAAAARGKNLQLQIWVTGMIRQSTGNTVNNNGMSLYNNRR